MGIQPKPETASLTLTAEERSTLLARYAVGDSILRGPRDPSWVDEIGQPTLSRREWGLDDAYMAREARIGQALNNLVLQDPSDEDKYVLSGSRDAIDYIRSCVFMSLINEDMVSSDIFEGNNEAHAGIGIYTRLRTLV
jgi:hypothetical protein